MEPVVGMPVQYFTTSKDASPQAALVITVHHSRAVDVVHWDYAGTQDGSVNVPFVPAGEAPQQGGHYCRPITAGEAAPKK
jgi:hypothetical protein